LRTSEKDRLLMAWIGLSLKMARFDPFFGHIFTTAQSVESVDKGIWMGVLKNLSCVINRLVPTGTLNFPVFHSHFLWRNGHYATV